MKRVAFALVALVATASLAQEIGTELTPATPTSAAQNPPPPPPPQQQAAQPQQAPSRAQAGNKDAAGLTGDKVTAASGDFGIRANLMGTSAIAVGVGGVAAPTLGFAYFTSDSFKLLIDVGVGVGLTDSNVALAFSAGVGFDYLFRTPADALRPFIHVLASFGFGGQLNNPALSLVVQGGFGAEYFFSKNFSANGKLLLGVPVGLAPNFSLQILTVTPGVGATWYF